MVKILIYGILLLILILIELYNWLYGIRLRRVKLQIGVSLPGFSLALLRISTLLVVFSFCTILLIALFTR